MASLATTAASTGVGFMGQMNQQAAMGAQAFQAGDRCFRSRIVDTNESGEGEHGQSVVLRQDMSMVTTISRLSGAIVVKAQTFTAYGALVTV
ncbi:MAG: hypothetical protein ACKOEC_22045 [Acidimicrobiia bacterium]